MGLGRKHILKKDDLISKGVTITGSTNIFFDLRLAFVGINDQRIRESFPNISNSALSILPSNEFKRRVRAFLRSKNIVNEDEILKLIDEVEFETQDCIDLPPCGLIDDFNIKNFLSGVRIGGVGDVNGTIKYRIYRYGQTPTPYQTSPQFLNLQNGVMYIASIIDEYNGNIVCEKNKTFTYTRTLESGLNDSFTIENYQVLSNSGFRIVLSSVGNVRGVLYARAFEYGSTPTEFNQSTNFNVNPGLYIVQIGDFLNNESIGYSSVIYNYEP